MTKCLFLIAKLGGHLPFDAWCSHTTERSFLSPDTTQQTWQQPHHISLPSEDDWNMAKVAWFVEFLFSSNIYVENACHEIEKVKTVWEYLLWSIPTNS